MQCEIMQKRYNLLTCTINFFVTNKKKLGEATFEQKTPN